MKNTYRTKSNSFESKRRLVNSIFTRTMQQQQLPPAVLNPFRTPNQQLHHHLQHQRNTSSCSSSSTGNKDGTNNSYGIHKNRWMTVVNSWIENPILRICYIMSIAMLLICLMMVGYEAFRKFSNQVTHTLIIGAPFSAVTVNTDTQPLSLDNVQVGVPDMDENESILEEIILPEILYKIPPKVAKVVSISNINSGNNIHSVVDVRQSSVRKGSKSHSSSSVSSSQQRKNGDDELVDEEGNEAGTTDHLPHDSIATLATTDDNVEQILRPKEIHSKLLGMATEDFKQSAMHEEQEQNYHGFGGDNVVTGNNEGIAAITPEDKTLDHIDQMVVVLPLRRRNDNGVVEVPVPEPVPVSPLLVLDDKSMTNTAIVERSRRLRHHVVAIPASSHS